MAACHFVNRHVTYNRSAYGVYLSLSLRCGMIGIFQPVDEETVDKMSVDDMTIDQMTGSQIINVQGFKGRSPYKKR